MRKNAEKNYSVAVSYICNVSNILTVGSELVISFFITVAIKYINILKIDASIYRR